MEFTSSTDPHDTESIRETPSSITIDRETLRRIDYALDGTINVDISKLDPDDKLTLLIERYNRKTRELDGLKSQG